MFSLKRYRKVFTRGLGTKKHFQAKFQVCMTSAYIVPFAVKDAIEIIIVSCNVYRRWALKNT